VKSSKWKYEAEWRMLLPLSESAEIIDKHPFPIYLFTFPSEAINRIILGTKLNAETKKTIKSELMSNKNLSHVELYQARLDSSSYRILLKKKRANKALHRILNSGEKPPPLRTDELQRYRMCAKCFF